MEAPQKVQLNTYLTFNGNCEEAFTFYQSVIGGHLDIRRFSEGPADMPIEPGHENEIMHVRFTFDECVLMASDSGGRPISVGNNFHLSVLFPDKERATNVFNQLSEGGKVTMPFNEVFWGGSFGSFEDKFGVNWMINCP